MIASTNTQATGLSGLDYAVIATYFVVLLAIGYFFSRRQNDTQEFFVGGRNTRPWVAGVSLFASLLSTISFLSVPGEIIKNGLASVSIVAASPLAFLLVGYVIVPISMRVRAISCYEYLEKRFDLKTRLFAASLFTLIRLSWMGVVVFAASTAVGRILGLGPQHMWLVALTVGAIAIMYTTMGGIKTVIWTDVVQVAILLGGLIYVVGYVALSTGSGPLAWWQELSAAAPHRESHPWWSWDPFTRVSHGGVIIFMFFWWICAASSDQVAVQRFFTTTSAQNARKAFGIGLITNALVMSLLALCGMALFFNYPGNLPATPDDVFPYFIGHGLPGGLAGLMVAALFSAAMSSLDSGMNSISSVVTTDFYCRLSAATPSPRTELRLARLTTLASGTLAIVICLIVAGIPDATRGNLTDLIQKINTFIVGGLGGLFFIAFFLPSCRASLAIASTVVGMTVGCVLAFEDWFPYFHFGVDAPGNPRSVSWMWVIPCSFLVTFLTGWLFSKLSRETRRL